MRYVYVLEDDPKVMQELSEALLLVDPKLQIRQFRTLELFGEWIKVVVAEGPPSVAKGGVIPEGVTLEAVPDSDVPVLQLVISKIEFLGPRQLGLLQKTRDLFIRHRLCTVEDPTAFVLTANEDPNFHIKDLRERILSNILMKPFDRLILQQHLTFALDGRHPPTRHAVAPYKTSAVIEVLKTIQMEKLSTIGFTTKSNRALPIGAVSKYYGKTFLSERKRSVIAKMIACDPDPANSDEFTAVFAYFGADPTQISSIRRRVAENKSQAVASPFSLVPSGKRKTCRIVFVDERQDMTENLETTFKRRIKGVEFVKYKGLRELLMELDPKLDTDAPTVKPLGEVPNFSVELDAAGKVTKLETKVSFLSQELSVGTSIATIVRESDRDRFTAFTAKPQGENLSVWSLGGKSFVMKVTFFQERKFKIEEATAFEKENYAKQNSRLAQGWDFMFVSHQFVSVDRLELWNEIVKRAKQLGGQTLFHLFIVAAADYSDEEEKKLATLFDDLFFQPVDRTYILQKMVLLCPDLGILDEPLQMLSIPQNVDIKSARPAQIEELSEAGLVMKYDRAMGVGSFREFVLWQPYEVDAPEINATCNFVEEGSEKGEWKLHFVFFAMKDILLKAIRVWILDSYIRSKDKG